MQAVTFRSDRLALWQCVRPSQPSESLRREVLLGEIEDDAPAPHAVDGSDIVAVKLDRRQPVERERPDAQHRSARVDDRFEPGLGLFENRTTGELIGPRRPVPGPIHQTNHYTDTIAWAEGGYRHDPSAGESVVRQRYRPILARDEKAVRSRNKGIPSLAGHSMIITTSHLLWDDAVP